MTCPIAGRLLGGVEHPVMTAAVPVLARRLARITLFSVERRDHSSLGNGSLLSEKAVDEIDHS